MLRRLISTAGEKLQRDRYLAVDLAAERINTGGAGGFLDANYLAFTADVEEFLMGALSSIREKLNWSGGQLQTGKER